MSEGGAGTSTPARLMMLLLLLMLSCRNGCCWCGSASRPLHMLRLMLSLQVLLFQTMHGGAAEDGHVADRRQEEGVRVGVGVAAVVAHDGHDALRG